MEKLIKEKLIPTIQMVRSLIEIELGFINTSHPDFVTGSQALMDAKEEERKGEAEKRKVEKESSIKEVQIDKKPDDSSSVASNKEKSGGFFGGLFGGGKSKDDVESKLQNLNMTSSKKDPNADIILADNPNNKFNRTYLPQLNPDVSNKKSIEMKDKISIEVTKKLIQSYFDVVKKNINDLVPKTIITFLIESVRVFVDSLNF